MAIRRYIKDKANRVKWEDCGKKGCEKCLSEIFTVVKYQPKSTLFWLVRIETPKAPRKNLKSVGMVYDL
jgi:hypothetical protein